jgi:hypothetical protein
MGAIGRAKAAGGYRSSASVFRRYDHRRLAALVAPLRRMRQR